MARNHMSDGRSNTPTTLKSVVFCMACILRGNLSASTASVREPLTALPDGHPHSGDGDESIGIENL